MNNIKRRINKMSRFIARHQDEIQSEYNLYCDKSCHLVSDPEPIMAIGAISCPKILVPLITADIRNIKRSHRFLYPIRWSHLNSTRLDLYQELLEYFFSNDFLRFHGIIIPDKRKLYPSRRIFRFELGYYTVYSQLGSYLMNNNSVYNFYISPTDAKSNLGIIRLRSTLNNRYSSEHIKNIQTVLFRESELLQLTNLFVGALSRSYRMPVINSIRGRVSSMLFKNKIANKFDITVLDL